MTVNTATQTTRKKILINLPLHQTATQYEQCEYCT